MSTHPNIFSHSLVQKIAQLSQVELTNDEEEKIQHAFAETLEVISNLNQINTEDVEVMGNVTGLSSILRPDQIDSAHTLSQEDSLKNAQTSYNGYFVVSRLVDND